MDMILWFGALNLMHEVKRIIGVVVVATFSFICFCVQYPITQVGN